MFTVFAAIMLMWVFVGAADQGGPVHDRPVWSAVAVLAVIPALALRRADAAALAVPVADGEIGA